MPHHNFEELEVWRRGMDVAVTVSRQLDAVGLFVLRDQMARAAISIPSNIAEGAEREADPDFRRFLGISKGSAGELRTQLILAERARILPQATTSPVIQELREIGSMLKGLMRTLPQAR